MNNQSLDPNQQEQLWQKCQREGMSRRLFLQLLSAGGAAAVLGSLPRVAGAQTPEAEGEPEEQSIFVKDTGPFIQHGTNLEAKLWELNGWITPNQRFFVRSNTPTPRIDVASYRLRVEGDAIDTPLELTYDELRRLPSRTVPAYIECAGNQRHMFKMVLGQEAEGTPWVNGGVGMASWTGVSLSHILEMAGVRENALQVNVKGLDEQAAEGGVSRPMSIEKAMDPDTILAYLMNGEELPPDNGYPLRAVVPGWVGSNNIKWAGLITVSSEPIWVKNNTTSYVLAGPEWPPEEGTPAEGKVLSVGSIKSVLALPWPGELAAGEQLIYGYAYSPHAPIAAVEWSDNGGETWQEANIVTPRLPYAWARFEFPWEAAPGEHGLMTRATDEAGNSQPDIIPYNALGYLFNMVYPHPVIVS